jgi:hypothetical protein
MSRDARNRRDPSGIRLPGVPRATKKRATIFTVTGVQRAERARLNLELAPSTAVEGRAKHRLDHVFAVQMCSHLPAKLSIGLAGQSLGRALEELLHGSRVAVLHALNTW